MEGKLLCDGDHTGVKFIEILRPPVAVATVKHCAVKPSGPPFLIYLKHSLPDTRRVLLSAYSSQGICVQAQDGLMSHLTVLCCCSGQRTASRCPEHFHCGSCAAKSKRPATDGVRYGPVGKEISLLALLLNQLPVGRRSWTMVQHTFNEPQRL